MPRSKSFAIAMSYCGAVIGAGFATGREVVDFFTVHGRQGLAGVLLAMILFMWAGTIILDVTHQNPVYSYLDFLKIVLRYRPLVFVADLLFLGTLLVGVGVMTAAGGTILAGWGIWYLGGCVLFLAVAVLVLRKGGTGFIKANSWLVPGMAIVIASLCIFKISVPVTTNIGPYGSALLYVAFNTAIAAVALATLKGHLDKRVVIWGGLGGGLLIGILLLLLYGATQGVIGHPGIPMIQLAELLMGRWQWIYALVLLASVFTTVLANLHGLASRVAAPGRYWFMLLIVAGMGLVVAQYGFANLVKFIYPLLGMCNIVLLLGLCYYSFNRLKPW